MAVPAAFGPFHRVHTRKQSDAVALAQERESRVCGLPFNWGGPASVKAYKGILPGGEHGIGFWTDALGLPGTAVSLLRRSETALS